MNIIILADTLVVQRISVKNCFSSELNPITASSIEICFIHYFPNTFYFAPIKASVRAVCCIVLPTVLT